MNAISPHDGARADAQEPASHASLDAPPSTVSLFCIPHAGGGTSAYRGWQAALGPRVSLKVLQLPGRESRFREPPVAELEAAVSDLLQQASPRPGDRCAFFGHSMGALLAFELCHRLRRSGGPQPVHLFVSACRAPGRPQLDAPCVALPQREFLAEITRRYGGIPAAILADEAFLAAMVPAMRADFAILERYRPSERAPLDCPISAFGGVHDATTPQEAIQDWRARTTGDFSLEMLDGDHFYLQSRRATLTARIRAPLLAMAGA